MRFFRFILIGVAFLFLHSCSGGTDNVNADMIYFPDADDVDRSQLPEITFKDTLFDYGRVIEGKQVEASYRFTNTGKKPLILTRVEPSCGCTVAKDWPKDPISPGESGQINISFDSNGRTGSQKKIISVIANTYPSTTVLYLNGEVLGPEKK